MLDCRRRLREPVLTFGRILDSPGRTRRTSERYNSRLERRRGRQKLKETESQGSASCVELGTEESKMGLKRHTPPRGNRSEASQARRRFDSKPYLDIKLAEAKTRKTDKMGTALSALEALVGCLVSPPRCRILSSYMPMRAAIRRQHWLQNPKPHKNTRYHRLL